MIVDLKNSGEISRPVFLQERCIIDSKGINLTAGVYEELFCGFEPRSHNEDRVSHCLAHFNLFENV